jgi:hypothetical protein
MPLMQARQAATLQLQFMLLPTSASAQLPGFLQ